MIDKQKSKNICVLLTGGTGFFGRALLRNWVSRPEFYEKNISICVLSRDPDNFIKQFPEFINHSWLHIHQGDILNIASFPKKGEFSHILHAAADSTLGPQLSQIERYNQIVDGTRNLLDFAVSKNISRFLLTSSGGVYGPQPKDMAYITEDYNGMPNPLISENAYSVAKRCAEHLCSLYRARYGIEIVIARCFTFVGRDLPLDAHFAIGNFIHDALYRNKILVKGDRNAVRTYLDQRDLANWLTTILFQGVDGEAYNVGSDIPMTIKEIANLVRDIISPQKTIEFLMQPSYENFRNRYVPSIDKANIKLGLKVRFNTREAIQEVIKRIKK